MNYQKSNVLRNMARFVAPLTVGMLVSLAAQAQEDLSVGGGVTVIGQAISNPDYATNGAADATIENNRGDGTAMTYSLDLTFEKELESGTAFVYLIGAYGDPVYDGGNADAEQGAFAVTGGDEGHYATIGFAEAWYAHNMFDEALTVKIGKINTTANYDGNEVANDPTAAFLADGFVNNKAIFFPGPYTAGVNVAATLFDEVLTVSAGIFEDMGHTIPGEFEGKFVIGELGLHYDLFDNAGNFRVTGWNSGYGDGFTARSGVAFNLDQGFGDELGAIYARLGFVFGAPVAEADLVGEQELAAETATAFSTGIKFNFGDGHSFGAAYELDSPQVETIPAEDARGNPIDQASAGIHWMEAYIDFAVTEGFNFAFDVQSIFNQGYDSEADAVFIPGFRVQASF